MKRVSLMLVLSLLISLPVQAGWQYTARTYQEGDGAASQAEMNVDAWIDGDNAKIVFTQSGNPMMQQGNYLLTTDGGQIVFLVNPQEQTVTEWDLQGVLNSAGEMMENMGGMIDFKISDPKVEKLLEEPGGDVVGFATTHFRFRTTYTMDMKIMGMGQSQAYEVLQDLWVTDEFSDPGMGVWLKKDPPKFGDTGLEELAKAEMSKVSGWPLKSIAETVTTDKKGRQKRTRTINEVLEANRVNIDPETYVIPATYDRIEMMPGMPPADQQQEQEEGGRFKGLFKRGG